MEWLVADAETDDALFLHCELHCLKYSRCHSRCIDSGHGSQQEDTDGDEADGIDEGTSVPLHDSTLCLCFYRIFYPALCPVDYTDSGLIVDDVLNDILVKPLPVGCRLTVLFDVRPSIILGIVSANLRLHP